MEITLTPTTEVLILPPQEFIAQLNEMIILVQINHRPTKPPKYNSYGQHLKPSACKRKPNPAVYHKGSINVVMDSLHTVLDPKSGEMQDCKYLIKGINAKLWIEANSKDISHLAQGCTDGTVIRTNIIHSKK